MPKQGQPKVAYKILLDYLNTDSKSDHKKRYIKSFIQDYIDGLYSINEMTNRGARIRMRYLWLQYFREKLEKYCKSKLPHFQYKNLENTLVTFYREHTRPDKKYFKNAP